MGAEALRILAQALTLSETERAELVAKLLASLDEPSDPDAEEAWAAEITKRAESVARGEAKLVAWDDVDAEAGQEVGEGPACFFRERVPGDVRFALREKPLHEFAGCLLFVELTVEELARRDDPNPEFLGLFAHVLALASARAVGREAFA